jgi:hypothetical protein
MGLVDGRTAYGEPLGCRSGRVGACGAGVAGSESQPYHRGRRVRRPGLQGGIEEAPDGARCLPIGFGEDRETRSLPGWALAGRGRAI